MISVNILTVYTAPGCVQCNATKRILDRDNIPYEMRPAEEQRSTLQENGYATLPVVVTPAGEHWGGFRPDLIAAYKSAL